MHSPMQATRIMRSGSLRSPGERSDTREHWPRISLRSCGLRHLASRDELAAELILDVDLDDVVEILFGRGEAELAGALGIEIARPAGDDAHDEGIGLALDAGGDLVAGDALQGGD